MHEVSLCRSLLDSLQEQAKVQHYRVVNTVWLEVGVLACVEPQALCFAFDAIKRGSLAENAQLHIIASPGRALCLSCHAEVALAQRYQSCPHCGGYQLQITAGDRLTIKELEVQ